MSSLSGGLMGAEMSGLHLGLGAAFIYSFFVFGLLRLDLGCSAGCPGTMKSKLAFKDPPAAAS